jgi:hypothetical protein
MRVVFRVFAAPSVTDGVETSHGHGWCDALHTTRHQHDILEGLSGCRSGLAGMARCVVLLTRVAHENSGCILYAT